MRCDTRPACPGQTLDDDDDDDDDDNDPMPLAEKVALRGIKTTAARREERFQQLLDSLHSLQVLSVKQVMIQSKKFKTFSIEQTSAWPARAMTSACCCASFTASRSATRFWSMSTQKTSSAQSVSFSSSSNASGSSSSASTRWQSSWSMMTMMTMTKII
jgi:hypothetical protein